MLTMEVQVHTLNEAFLLFHYIQSVPQGIKVGSRKKENLEETCSVAVNIYDAHERGGEQICFSSCENTGKGKANKSF